MADLSEKWRIVNNQAQLALGEKEFSADVSEILKAAITGFSDRNIAVLNLDKELGYLLAEGKGIITGPREREIAEAELLPALEKATGIDFNYVPGNYTVRINLNIFKKGNNSLVRMRLSNTVAGTTANMPVAHELHPSLLKEHYKILWEVIEKNLFIQKETS